MNLVYSTLRCLRESQCVSTAYSEEQAEAIVMGFHG